VCPEDCIAGRNLDAGLFEARARGNLRTGTFKTEDDFVNKLKRRVLDSLPERREACRAETALSPRATAMLDILRSMPPGQHSMYQIVEWLTGEGRFDEITTVILGRRASTAQSYILRGTEVCCTCREDTPCARRLGNLPSEMSRIELLKAYRFDVCDAFLRALSKTPQLLRLLLEDPLMLKLGVSYQLTTCEKHEMRTAGLLSGDCRILRKDHGLYCPMRDFWEVRE